MVSRRRSSGFTITELMIVVAIAGILTAFALPEFRALVTRTRLKTAASDLHSSLMLARSEAIKRNGAVSIVPNDTSDWSRGWQVRFGSAVLSAQDPHPAVTFTPRSAAYTSKTVTSITFQGTGREGSTDGVAFVLTSSAMPGISARCVVLDPSGRPTVRSDVDNDPSDGCN